MLGLYQVLIKWLTNEKLDPLRLGSKSPRGTWVQVLPLPVRHDSEQLDFELPFADFALETVIVFTSWAAGQLMILANTSSTDIQVGTINFMNLS